MGCGASGRRVGGKGGEIKMLNERQHERLLYSVPREGSTVVPFMCTQRGI